MVGSEGASGAGRDLPSIRAELAALSDNELTMMLVDWRRWRARVQTEPAMRLRGERFEEATAYIDAITDELACREPGERLRRQQLASARLQDMAGAATVSLDAYRQARLDLARLEAARHPAAPGTGGPRE